MKKGFALSYLLFVFGLAILLSILFFDGGAGTISAQSLTPTPDRLAEPTVPASPSQADLGAQVYWLSCLPCHGDRGQGLTDEFRAIYPPEEQYCWERGCHGDVPYESGFTLPKTIPGIVGEQTLAKFTNAAQLQAYIRATMPFWKPGSLTDEDSWKVTAFVLRSNGLWSGMEELGPQNASQVKIQRGAVTPTPVATTLPDSPSTIGVIGLSAIVVLFIVRVILIFIRMKRTLD